MILENVTKKLVRRLGLLGSAVVFGKRFGRLRKRFDRVRRNKSRRNVVYSKYTLTTRYRFEKTGGLVKVWV